MPPDTDIKLCTKTLYGKALEDTTHLIGRLKLSLAIIIRLGGFISYDLSFPDEGAEFNMAVVLDLYLLAKWKYNSKISYDQYPKLLRKISINNFSAATKLIAFVVRKQKADHLMLDKNISKVTV
jgi:hypothetical protein